MPFLLLSERTRDASVHDARSRSPGGSFITYHYRVTRPALRDAAISPGVFPRRASISNSGKRPSALVQRPLVDSLVTPKPALRRSLTSNPQERPTCVARARLSSPSLRAVVHRFEKCGDVQMGEARKGIGDGMNVGGEKGERGRME